VKTAAGETVTDDGGGDFFGFAHGRKGSVTPMFQQLETRAEITLMRIRISWPAGQAHAWLEDTPTVRRLLEALPITARANTWGEEVYFDTGVDAELEPDARQVVDPGTVCFWVEGKALALPYGPTPASHGDECRLVSEVNLLGKLEEEANVLASVGAGDEIRVERINA
jgi:hypothetical protein